MMEKMRALLEGRTLEEVVRGDDPWIHGLPPGLVSNQDGSRISYIDLQIPPVGDMRLNCPYSQKGAFVCARQSVRAQTCDCDISPT